MANAPSNYLDRQASFSGGEVSSETYGRTDSPTYKAALKLSKNGYGKRHGAWTNRAGTKYVGTSQTSPLGGIPPRPIRFRFSDSQTYVLEFGHLYMTIWSFGGPLLNGAAQVTVATPWVIQDVWALKYAQSGDVITFCNRGSASTPVVVDGTGATIQGPPPVGYAPYDLNRFSNTNWTLTKSLISPPAWPWPAVTSPSFPVDPVGATPGQGSTGAIALYNPFGNYPADSVVEYTQNSGTPTANTAVYFANDQIIQAPAGPSLYPSGATGPLAAPSVYWSLFTFDHAVTFLVNQYVYAADDALGLNGILYQAIQQSTGVYPPSNIGASAPDLVWQVASDASHPSSPVTYAITMDLRNASGVVVESLPTYYTPPGGVFPRFPDRPVGLQFNPAAAPAGYTITGFNIYVGTNGTYGLVDSIDASLIGSQTGPYWIDTGGAPDYNTAPPAGTNPFVTNAPTAPAVYSWPGVVAYFQQRRLFARTGAFPNSFWGSAIGYFLDFDQPTFITDSDSFQFLVAAQDECEIRGIAPQRELFIMSSSAEFVASGSNGGVGGAITPSSIDIRSSSNHGISYLDPIPIDREVLDVTSKGNYLRKLAYDWRTANYLGSDISSLARHLFDGYTIVDWFYAETPDSLVYMVRSDGALITLTYDPSFEVVAYGQHFTNNQVPANNGGQFRAVTSVPEGTEDAVYYVVQRIINGAPVYYIERQSSRFVNGPNGILDYRQANFLDCAFEYNGRNTAQSSPLQSVVASGNQYIVTLLNPGQIGGASRPFVANDAVVGNEVVLQPDGVPQPNDVNGQPVAPLPPVKLRIVGYTSAIVVTCELDTPPPASFAPYVNTTAWGIAVATITGLAPLNGQAVSALVDGNVVAATDENGNILPSQVVQVGSVTLPNPGVDVIVGLPYNSDLQLLDLALDTAKTNVKTVEKVSLEVSNSRSFFAGEDFEHLSETDTRQLTDNYAAPALITGTIVCPTSGTYNISGSMCVRNSDPVPLTIVAAIREVSMGGRG